MAGQAKPLKDADLPLGATAQSGTIVLLENASFVCFGRSGFNARPLRFRHTLLTLCGAITIGPGTYAAGLPFVAGRAKVSSFKALRGFEPCRGVAS